MAEGCELAFYKKRKVEIMIQKEKMLKFTLVIREMKTIFFLPNTLAKTVISTFRKEWALSYTLMRV